MYTAFEATSNTTYICSGGSRCMHGRASFFYSCFIYFFERALRSRRTLQHALDTTADSLTAHSVRWFLSDVSVRVIVQCMSLLFHRIIEWNR